MEYIYDSDVYGAILDLRTDTRVLRIKYKIMNII